MMPNRDVPTLLPEYYQASYTYWCLDCQCQCGGGLCNGVLPDQVPQYVVCPMCSGNNIAITRDQ